MTEATDKTIRVALYARVSTEEQREGQTIESQITELDRFARDRCWLIAAVYRDDGWSGGLLARPELDRLRDDASRRSFDAVLINDVDRLARDVSHLGIVKRDLERQGIKVIFRKLPAEISPTHNLMVNILGSFAEFERELILDRTRRGRRHKVEMRKQYLGSLAPYGFRYTPKDRSANKEGRLEVVPEDASVVRQMFEWVDKGLSARQVVERLSSMRVRPRKGGAAWAKSSVLRILRSETYCGVWHYNKYESCEPKRARITGKYRRSLKGSLRARPKNEWIAVNLPDEMRIVERDQWQRVQEHLDRNITFSPRNSKHRYLLSGLVKCAGCGARFVGDPCHGKFYYRCHRRCKQVPSVKEERLDRAVWDAIEAAILEPAIFIEQLERFQQRRAVNDEKLRKETVEIDRSLTQLQGEEDRVMEAYRQGIITPAELGRELEQLRARRSAIEARKDSLATAPDPSSFEAAKVSVTQYCQLAARRLKQFDPAERQQFLRLLVDEVIFDGSLVKIRGVLPPRSGGEYHAAQQEALSAQSSEFADSRIAIMESYHSGRNSVSEPLGTSFEIIRPIGQPRQPERIAT